MVTVKNLEFTEATGISHDIKGASPTELWELILLLQDDSKDTCLDSYLYLHDNVRDFKAQ